VTLRSRLALTAALVIAPTVALLWSLDAVARHRAAEQLLGEIVSARLPTERDRCESSPESWGGLLPGGPRFPGPLSTVSPPGSPRPPDPPPPAGVRRRARPAVVFAYDEHLRSRNPASPPVPSALALAINGRESAVEPFAWRSSEVELLLRTPWGTGPCAFVLAQGTTGEWGAVLPETHVWMLPMLIVFAAVLLAVGPVVRRIRLLTEAVRRSASTSYEQSVFVPGRDEIGELARAFDVAGREIRMQLRDRERRETALRDFVANTTHDVMIPLTVLQGHLMTLREGLAANDPVDAGTVSSAMDEAHYMASLVHNLAAAARLDAVEATLQPSDVDVGALVARVVGRHRPIARERGILLESAFPSEPISAWADITLLEQAVSNITYNAIRYNRPGGNVAVILELVPPGRFCIRVVDDGPGIASAELSKMAARGVRGNDARTRAPEGQGLGLHIAYRAAELHGFQLTLAPSEYGGLEARLEGSLGRANPAIAVGGDGL
jgi:two-component system sensor histidine kinase BaeS